MPKRRVIISPERRLQAYEHVIHDLVNTIVNIRQVAQNGMDGITDPFVALERTIGFATGRLETQTERMEPLYRGYHWEEVKHDD